MSPVLLWIFRGIATLALLLAAGGLWRARAALRGTSLPHAMTWGAAAWALWTAAGVADAWAPAHAGWRDQLWYQAVLVTLCTSIAVLGARRPGARVWDLFVLVPLWLVLGWPALTAFRHGLDPRPLALRTPALVGLGLVAVMGLGNFFRTRHGWSAAWLAAALECVVATLAERWDVGAAESTWRIAALGCLGVAAGVTFLPATSPAGGHAWDRVWADFRDSFGIVWAQRFRERVNAAAVQHHWPVRLQLEGFQAVESEPPVDQARCDRELDHTLRWLLRRFVDPEWIAARLPADYQPVAALEPKMQSQLETTPL